MCNLVMDIKVMWIILLYSISYSHGEVLRRTILGVGEMYYAILMSLGTCSDDLLFAEQKIWSRVRMNRIFDVYYKSYNDNSKVSRVEIKLIVSDSDVMCYSEEGVGKSTFSATVFLPLNTHLTFYSLRIFGCKAQRDPETEKSYSDEYSNSDS